MADSYIYTLPEAAVLSATDYAVVDTYDNGAANYITKKAQLHTIAATVSSSLVDPLTSKLPIDVWNSTYSTVHANSGVWNTGGDALTVLSINSGSWQSTTTTVRAKSANWDTGGSSYTTLNAHSGDWQSTYNTVYTTSAVWLSSGKTFLELIDEMSINTLTTVATAYGEFILVNVGGLPRAIQLWQY